ncbi:AAA family ATPase [Nonomuraea sp. NPDC047529]|uniref:AAA family ATPase n=1 Tax=Nonomuraea sp. NPDC047529 TaxID=3155623 RepID=UPI0033E56986
MTTARSNPNRKAVRRGPRHTPPMPNLISTKEHRRFCEFADTVRVSRYIGLCYGPAGVGKTLSAHSYARWPEQRPLLEMPHALADWFHAGANRPDWHTVLYTPLINTPPRRALTDLTDLTNRHAMVRARNIDDPKRETNLHGASLYTELVIIDESERLTTRALEQVRDFYDRSSLGLILIGMPGIEKRLARYPQLYSRIGFVHHYRTLAADELATVLTVEPGAPAGGRTAALPAPSLGDGRGHLRPTHAPIAGNWTVNGLETGQVKCRHSAGRSCDRPT